MTVTRSFLKLRTRSALPSVLSEIIDQLNEGDFVIFTKVEFSPHPEVSPPRSARSILIRAGYPRSRLNASLRSPTLAHLVRCSILVEELGTGQVSVELTKFTRLSDLEDLQVLRNSEEVDLKLQAIAELIRHSPD